MKSYNVRRRFHEIIYEADTLPGKLFDLALFFLILLSIAAVMLESVEPIKAQYGAELSLIERIITIFFTLEYIGRLIAVDRPLKFVVSRNGIIDLLATLPGYIDLLFPGLHFLVSIRAIRLLRIFRILKLSQFTGASDQLVTALAKSRQKIVVFVSAVIVVCIILGTLMYLVEGPESGFTSIPTSVYWTIVTLTTVGFGDITPLTPAGQFISTVIMILGYGIIAVPTGLVSAAYLSNDVQHNTQSCPNCSSDHHRDDAEFCYHCGHHLNN